MVFWYIFLFMLFWGLCGWIFFLLHDALWFGVFFEVGSWRKFDTRGFSWWSNALAQTQLFELPQSASSRSESSPVKMLSPTPNPPNPAPPSPLPLNMSFIPHRDAQLTSFDWEPANPISLSQDGIHLRYRSKAEQSLNEKTSKHTKNNSQPSR